MEKWLIPVPRQAIHRNLEHVLVSENKESTHTYICEYVKGTQEPTEKAPNGQSCTYLRNKTKEVILDYNPKDKINTKEPILI